jgi:hypothetical protein
MSLLAASPGTLYLGELFNYGMPFAHANVVDPEATAGLVVWLYNNLPQKPDPPPKNITPSAMRSPDLGRRIQTFPSSARELIEAYAVHTGGHTLLYKFFNTDHGTLDWLENLKAERCVHFLFMQRNFLRARFSLLEVEHGGGWLGSNSSDVIPLDLNSLPSALKSAMLHDIKFHHILAAEQKAAGAQALISYEEIVALDKEPLSATTRDFVVDKLDQSATSAVAKKANAHLSGLKKNNDDASSSLTSHVLCPFSADSAVHATYKRQDSRTTLESKVSLERARSHLHGAH